MEDLRSYIEEEFDKNVIPSLMDYIRIPNLSPAFDPEWETNGNAEKACNHIVSWIVAQKLINTSVEILKDPGKTHLILVEVAATDAKCEKTALLYTHWDKQPPMEGRWDPGLGPFTPVIKDGKLFGRGTCDDGYASFAAVLIVKACQKFGLKHPRIVMTFESCEESGKEDLSYYLEKLSKTKLKRVDAIFCIDAAFATQDRLWLTSSLRGIINFNLTARVLKVPAHSGDAGGIVPDSFNILRQLLARIEDMETGKMCDAVQADIPKESEEELEVLAKILSESLLSHYSWEEGVEPRKLSIVEHLKNQTWRPALCVIGADGLPSISDAGNVLRTHTTLKISIRLPPLVNAEEGIEKLKAILTKDPPFGAKVEVAATLIAKGWCAKGYPAKFKEALKSVSKQYFGEEYSSIAGSGSIPFVTILEKQYPEAIMIVTGAASIDGNAHGPNEFLVLDYTKKFTLAMTQLITNIE